MGSSANNAPPTNARPIQVAVETPRRGSCDGTSGADALREPAGSAGSAGVASELMFRKRVLSVVHEKLF
jgi:hypothetical protein